MRERFLGPTPEAPPFGVARGSLRFATRSAPLLHPPAGGFRSVTRSFILEIACRDPRDSDSPPKFWGGRLRIASPSFDRRSCKAAKAVLDQRSFDKAQLVEVRTSSKKTYRTQSYHHISVRNKPSAMMPHKKHNQEIISTLMC